MQWWNAFIDMLEANMAADKESSEIWLLTELLELKKSAQSSTVEAHLIPKQLSHKWRIETDAIPEICDLTS